MSLDNVLGVAGAARDHPTILAFGLVFSVAVMGLAASLIARVVDRYRWIGYLGLAVIVWVALKMIHSGLLDRDLRSDEHTSELQSLMRIAYAVFCLKTKTTNTLLDT